jgi:sugar/nucleoside kinase (ribokinase family)
MTLDIVAIGDSVVDVVVPSQGFSGGMRTVSTARAWRGILGGSSNYLIAASRLGLRVGVAGCIGDDDLGVFYRAGLEAKGIDTSRLLVREGDRTSGCIVILTSRGKHAYVGLEGVSRTYSPDEFDEGYVLEARSLFISGYPLAENPIAFTEPRR